MEKFLFLLLAAEGLEEAEAGLHCRFLLFGFAFFFCSHGSASRMHTAIIMFVC